MANENIELQDLSAEELKEKTRNVFEDNKNLIYGVIGAVIVLALGIYWYTQMYQKPREAAAQVELYKANQQMNRDSFTLALTGRNIKGQADNFIGYVGIIEQYSGTDASNLAHYYAGAASLRLEHPEWALDYLGSFSGEELMQAQAYNMMGDAASELEQFDKALGYYQDAAGYTENVSLQCYAKYKAGKLSEHMDKKAEAIQYYQEIMDTDAQVGEGLGVDKDLLRLK